MSKADVEIAAPSVERTSDVDKGSVAVGRENLHAAVAPHASYEGGHRWDPSATWTPEEEKAVIRKTDLKLLTWLCVMVCLCTTHNPH